MNPALAPVTVLRFGEGPAEDELAVEEPLEIRVGFGPPLKRSRRAVAVTMRTPGHDAELAVGYLFAEGVLAGPGDLLAVVPSKANPNVIRVDLRPGIEVDLARLRRNAVGTSACGVCGKTSLAAVERACDPAPPGLVVPAAVVHSLPDKLRAAQPAFARTGGLHAAGLFAADGELLSAREDVGRHNALDKLLGGRVPLAGRVACVSGRASFELVQKAAAAGVPVLAAVGAPTSLAVELARRVGLTLLGFVRDGRFNVYSGAGRIRPD